MSDGQWPDKALLADLKDYINKEMKVLTMPTILMQHDRSFDTLWKGFSQKLMCGNVCL